MSETKVRKEPIGKVIRLALIAGFPLIFLCLAMLVLYLNPEFVKERDLATMSEAFKSFMGCAAITSIATLFLGLFFFKRAFRHKFHVDIYNNIVEGGGTPYGSSPQEHAKHTRKMKDWFIAAGVTSIIFLTSFVVCCFAMASFLDALKFTGLSAIVVFNLWWRYITFR